MCKNLINHECKAHVIALLLFIICLIVIIVTGIVRIWDLVEECECIYPTLIVFVTGAAFFFTLIIISLSGLRKIIESKNKHEYEKEMAAIYNQEKWEEHKRRIEWEEKRRKDDIWEVLICTLLKDYSDDKRKEIVYELLSVLINKSSDSSKSSGKCDTVINTIIHSNDSKITS